MGLPERECLRFLTGIDVFEDLCPKPFQGGLARPLKHKFPDPVAQP